MKTYKTQAWTFGIISIVLLGVLVFVTYKWMQLRKNVAKVATKTTNPTPASIKAAVTTIQSQASTITD